MKCFAPGLATFDDQLALTVQQAVTRSFLTARAALGASALKSLQLLMCIRKTPLYFTPLPSRRSFAFPPFLFLFLFFVDLFSLVAFLLIAIVILPFVYLLVRAWLRFFGLLCVSFSSRARLPVLARCRGRSSTFHLIVFDQGLCNGKRFLSGISCGR